MSRIYIVLGLGLLAASVLLLALRGAPVVGAVVAVVGLALFFFSSKSSLRGGVLKDPETGGPFLDVKNEYLDGRVDLSTNVLRGVVRKGLFAGHRVGGLHAAELALVWQDCRSEDPRSGELIEKHLDVVAPRWRDDIARGEAQLSSGPDGRMSVAQAYKILGLVSGANVEQIRHAHRDLMLKLHPDRGGSTYLSSKVNEAKDILLNHAKR